MALNYGWRAARCFFDIAERHPAARTAVENRAEKRTARRDSFRISMQPGNTLPLRVALARVAYAQYANMPPASRTAVHPAKEGE
jgi:hypothetical protein